MKHDQVSERGVTSAHGPKGGREGEFLSLFLRVVDIRTRIRRLVEGVGDTNEGTRGRRGHGESHLRRETKRQRGRGEGVRSRNRRVEEGRRAR